MLDKHKDQSDQKEVSESKTAAELQRHAVLGETADQARWNRAQQAHYLGQNESATDLFRKSGDAQKSSNKFSIDGIEEETQKIAYDLKDLQKDWNNGLKKAGTFADCSKESLISVEAPASIDALHPHRGNEDAYISYQACAAANNAFGDIKTKIGTGKGHIDPYLIAGILRREQEFYKQGTDTGQDRYIQEHGKDDGIGSFTSIGPAQMQIRHISRLVAEFPEQLGKFAQDPLRAALKPENAPLLVAGYFNKVIKHIKTGTKPEFVGGIDWSIVKNRWYEGDLNGALIHSYNPAKGQAENVMNHVKIIHAKRKN